MVVKMAKAAHMSGCCGIKAPAGSMSMKQHENAADTDKSTQHPCNTFARPVLAFPDVLLTTSFQIRTEAEHLNISSRQLILKWLVM